MPFVTTRGNSPPVPLKTALFSGLAPDGSLYVPQLIEPWQPAEIDALPSMTLSSIGARVLRPFVAGEIDDAALDGIVARAGNFPIPLGEVEPGVHALELFHGPTLAFKDVGARVMALLMAALHDGGDPHTILVATSGDTGGAVGYAFHDVPHTRVVILYPAGGVSPVQEAQLARFNGETAGNVRAYAIPGTFDDCQRLVKDAFADAALRAAVRLSSANSINVGRLLPQMIYYFEMVARGARGARVTTPSGNFGNLTAGLMAMRAGLPVASFVAATNVNDVVPEYLATGRFAPRPSIHTIANAMDCGNPSNFERMLWLYGGCADAMRKDVAGSAHDDEEVRAAIRRVDRERGYVLDPHSAIAYLGAIAGRDERRRGSRGGDRTPLDGTPHVFLATAHPAKFAETVEPLIGRRIEPPPALAEALALRPRVRRIDATAEALRAVLTRGNDSGA
jgi:threonine synthase